MLCKVCFLARKDKQRDREPSPFGLFTRIEMTPFPTLSYTSASEIRFHAITIIAQMMIKTKKDKINEINTKLNVKARILLPESWLLKN